MKIHIKNLGVLRQAEFELGDLTIICGGNNTGKTYATYALFGFLVYWQEAFTVSIPNGTVNNLLVEGSTQLDIEHFVHNAQDILTEACKNYTKQMYGVFAAAEKNFESTEFRVSIDVNDIHPLDTFEMMIGSATVKIFSITKQAGHSNITISLLVPRPRSFATRNGNLS